MTIEIQLGTVTHTGNGAATEFAYDFRIPEASDAHVILYRKSTEVRLELSTAQYTITGLGNDNGGTVIYELNGAPISNDYLLTIERRVPYTQELDLINQGGYYPASVERGLDALEMQIQQLAGENALTLKLPSGISADDLDLTLPVPDDGTLLGWGPSGNIINYDLGSAELQIPGTNTVGDSQIIDSSVKADKVDLTDLLNWMVSLNIPLTGYLFGMRDDNATDNTAAVNDMAAYATATGYNEFKISRRSLGIFRFASGIPDVSIGFNAEHTGLVFACRDNLALPPKDIRVNRRITVTNRNAAGTITFTQYIVPASTGKTVAERAPKPAMPSVAFNPPVLVDTRAYQTGMITGLEDGGKLTFMQVAFPAGASQVNLAAVWSDTIVADVSPPTATSYAGLTSVSALSYTIAAAENLLRSALYRLQGGDLLSWNYSDVIARQGVLIVFEGGQRVVWSDPAGTFNFATKLTGAAPTSSLARPFTGQEMPQYNPIRADWQAGLVNEYRVITRLNGIQMDDYTAPGRVFYVGPITQCVSGALAGYVVEGIVKRRLDRMPTPELLTLGFDGDSRTADGRASVSERVRDILDGRYGIRLYSTLNRGVNGETSTQVEARMASLGVQGCGVFVIGVGTNDVQGGAGLNTFVSKMSSLIDLIRAGFSIPIIRLLPMFYDQAESGQGFDTAGYLLRARYVTALRVLCAEKAVHIVDEMEVYGRYRAADLSATTGIDPGLRDNIHNTEYFDMLLSEAVADAIVTAICPRMSPKCGPSAFLATRFGATFTTTAGATGLQYSVSEDRTFSMLGQVTCSVTNAANVTVLTLPQNLRPTKQWRGNVIDSTGVAVLCDVTVAGLVVLYNVVATRTYYLNSISYKLPEV